MASIASKKKKVLIIALSVGLSIVLAAFSTVYFLFLHRYKGSDKTYDWHYTDVFNISAVASVKKQSGKAFTILNLADVQMCDLEDAQAHSAVHKEIDYLVDKVKPDLITLTGDQTWSNENLISLRSLIGWLDGYGIPYAPVFGNHDYGNDYNSAVASVNYCCDLYESGKYSLFDRGPTNIGALGNYVVNVTEDGKIVCTLYMLDAGYNDTLTDGQKDWLKWNADGIKMVGGGDYVDGICFMHKPLPEYAYAYYGYLSGENIAKGDVQVHYSLSGTRQNGFFDVAKQVGVKNVVCGHQHGNNFTIGYEGVDLTFALKTGELGGYYDDGTVYINGATVLKIEGGQVEAESLFVDRDAFHVRNSNIVYYD